MEVLLVAAKKDMVQTHAELIRDAGYSPMVIEVASFANQNSWEYLHGGSALDALDAETVADAEPSNWTWSPAVAFPGTLAEQLSSHGVDVEAVMRLLLLHNRVSIRASDGDDGTGPVDRLKARRSAEPSRCAQKDRVEDLVEQWICRLGEKQRIVLERRFGLHGHRRATLEQIGREIGVTRERVRQIQIDALKALRAMIESHGISGDMILD